MLLSAKLHGSYFNKTVINEYVYCYLKLLFANEITAFRYIPLDLWHESFIYLTTGFPVCVFYHEMKQSDGSSFV